MMRQIQQRLKNATAVLEYSETFGANVMFEFFLKI
jgi:hypothetical protein